MEIKILAPEEKVELKEKDIQRAFERDLSRLEEGLEFVDTEVMIGTGRIDTLAFDRNSGQPVFIEYKGPGEFGKDALVQLMDYLSWFARDENRMAVLEKMVRHRKPDVGDFEPEIRLICVAADIEERIRNAIYAVANHVKVFTYMVARDTSNNVVVVPRLEVDNSDVEPQVRGAIPESELLARHPHLREAFEALRIYLERDGAVGYTTRRSFRFRKERVFAKVHFQKKHLLLELLVGRGKVSDSDFQYWRQGESSWGYTHVRPSGVIPEKVVGWIDLARNYVAAKAESEEDEEEGPSA